MYAFDLVQKRSRKPADVPDLALARDVTKVGVVGAGLMAGQLALLFARSLQIPVLLTDVDQARLDAGVTAVHANITALVRNNRITPADADRLTALISGSLDYADFADADFIIEAVYESTTVKQAVFAELEKFITPTTILASNTSSLSISEIAKGLQHPERVIGYHFFNPVDVMPLLEIVRGEQTDDHALATAFALAGRLKKGAILVKDQTGFVVNRLLLRSMGEVLAAIDEGTPIDVADDALAPLGLPMTTMQLVQLTGPAVVLHVQQTLHETFGDRFPVSENLRRIVDAGHRTVLTRDHSHAHTVDPEILALLTQGNRPSTSEQVRSRVLQALAQEARQMLDDGVIADAKDIDLAMITGAGWPTWLGGITPYLDREGISEHATGKRFAPAGVATLPTGGHTGLTTRSITPEKIPTRYGGPRMTQRDSPADDPAGPPVVPNGGGIAPPFKRKRHPAVLEERARRVASLQLRIADRITAAAGSMRFVYFHIALFAVWMVFLESRPWPTLTLIVSLEAIFLSTFVMIGQNRQAAFQQAKADHDFNEQELELKTNTQLTREIHRLTTELHGRVIQSPAGDLSSVSR